MGLPAIAPEIAEAMVAKIEEVVTDQAVKDKVPVWQEYANILSAFDKAGLLKWIIAFFCMYEVHILLSKVPILLGKVQ